VGPGVLTTSSDSFSLYMFYFQTQNRQAYGLAKELLTRTSSAIEPFVQAVSGLVHI